MGEVGADETGGAQRENLHSDAAEPKSQNLSLRYYHRWWGTLQRALTGIPPPKVCANVNRMRNIAMVLLSVASSLCAIAADLNGTYKARGPAVSVAALA